MHIVHGTWIPEETDDFIQRGGFFLWIETDTATGTGRKAADNATHPRHLAGDALTTFLAETVHLSTAFIETRAHSSAHSSSRAMRLGRCYRWRCAARPSWKRRQRECCGHGGSAAAS